MTAKPDKKMCTLAKHIFYRYLPKIAGSGLELPENINSSLVAFIYTLFL
jgi:hypothetical protein